jgi:hypothetical protein
LNFVNLDQPYNLKPDEFPFPSQEAVGTKTAAEIEADFLRTYAESQPHGRPEGGLTIEEMAKAANVGHASIRRWLEGQTGYKAILGTKQYATRKQVVTYYVKQ